MGDFSYWGIMLTDKQEKFAVNVAVKGMNYTEAWMAAGYSKNYPLSVLQPNASRLAAKSKVKARIEVLRNELEGPDILSQREYLAGITKVFRTKITDFQTCGADGSSYIDIGPEHPNAEAVAEIVSKTEYDKDGADAAVITRVKLHDKLEAGRDIAKVKGWWGKLDGGGNTTNNVFVNRVEIFSNGHGEKKPFKELVETTGESKE